MSEEDQEMDAWWFRIAYVALFIIFFFVFRYFFNRWRRQALEEQAALHNLQLANQADMESGNGSRERNIIIDDSPPPEFEIAVKYSAPLSYIEIDCAPPAYEDAVKTITLNNRDPETHNESQHSSGSRQIISTPGDDVINHI